MQEEGLEFIIEMGFNHLPQLLQYILDDQQRSILYESLKQILHGATPFWCHQD